MHAQAANAVQQQPDACMDIQYSLLSTSWEDIRIYARKQAGHTFSPLLSQRNFSLKARYVMGKDCQGLVLSRPLITTSEGCFPWWGLHVHGGAGGELTC